MTDHDMTDPTRGIRRGWSGYYSYTVLHGACGTVTVGGYPCEAAAINAAEADVARLHRIGLASAHRKTDPFVDLLDEWIDERIAAGRAACGGRPPVDTGWGDLDYLSDDDQKRLTEFYAKRRRQMEKADAWHAAVTVRNEADREAARLRRHEPNARRADLAGTALGGEPAGQNLEWCRCHTPRRPMVLADPGGEWAHVDDDTYAEHRHVVGYDHDSDQAWRIGGDDHLVDATGFVIDRHLNRGDEPVTFQQAWSFLARTLIPHGTADLTVKVNGDGTRIVWSVPDSGCLSGVLEVCDDPSCSHPEDSD